MTLRPLALALVASFVVFGRPAGAAADEPPPPYPAHAAPLYMIVSFDDTFVVSGPHPSQTIVVNLGTLTGGDGFIDTQFAVNQALTTIQYPEGRRAPTFDQIADNSATIVGSFKTTDLSEIHMVTPTSGEIAPDIQAAVFMASNGGAIDSLLAGDPFPTTEEIAEVIAAHLPDGSTATETQILSAVFNSGAPLNAGDFGASTVGEGEMFPHQPQSSKLFHYKVELFEDGTITNDTCKWVGVDVHPGSSTNPVNVKSKNGQLPIAILTVAGFDALSVDASTATIGGVSATSSTEADVDDDGDVDLLLHWDVEDLVDAGVLTLQSKSITVNAETTDGGCIVGEDAIKATKN